MFNSDSYDSFKDWPRETALSVASITLQLDNRRADIRLREGFSDANAPDDHNLVDLVERVMPNAAIIETISGSYESISLFTNNSRGDWRSYRPFAGWLETDCVLSSKKTPFRQRVAATLGALTESGCRMIEINIPDHVVEFWMGKSPLGLEPRLAIKAARRLFPNCMRIDIKGTDIESRTATITATGDKWTYSGTAVISDEAISRYVPVGIISASSH